MVVMSNLTFLRQALVFENSDSGYCLNTTEHWQELNNVRVTASSMFHLSSRLYFRVCLPICVCL